VPRRSPPTTSRLVSGHVFRRRGARGDVWYAKYRLPDGRQVKRRIGPAWSERGRPAEGYFTRRASQAWNVSSTPPQSTRTHSHMKVSVDSPLRGR
jgi:hypothetical protein